LAKIFYLLLFLKDLWTLEKKGYKKNNVTPKANENNEAITRTDP